MGGLGKILGVILIVIALCVGGVGAAFMFYIAPTQAEETTFPTDFDQHNLYGGYLEQLNTGNGQVERVDFTIDRRIQTVDELGGGELELEENIVGKENNTGAEIDALTKHNIYHIDEQSINLYYFKDLITNDTLEYTKDDEVQWIFPHPVDKDEDYNVFNMNILDYSGAQFIGEEEIYGVNCYVYRGEEVEYEIPIPESTAASLGALAAGSTMKLTLWEKAWVHPLTGSIIDYAKEINTYLYLPDLPAVPEIMYPSDLTSTTGFDGDLVLFDQATASFVTFEGIKAERMVEVISADGDNYTTNESVTVTAADGTSLALLDSDIQVVFNARDGSHQGPGRTGQYLFSPQGAMEMNYSIWDDGFGMEVNAEYMGKETEMFPGLVANIYQIYVENETYLAGGIATLDMTYWVEEMSGIVLDASKKVINWRPQDARRLPLDTAMINKTVTLNATITSINPLTMERTPMEIYVEQMINCSGYTDMTYGVAKISETVTKYLLPEGILMGAPEVTMFGVDAYTMDYVDVDGWSTMDRDGQFTFPIGLLNETMEVTPSFLMYNSDLGESAPVILTEEMEMNGLQVAKYEMNLTGIPLTYEEVEATLGQPIGLPGATGTYGCLYEYYVDIDTGTMIDIVRSVSINLVPPTYEFLWDNLNSTSVVKGEFMSENVTMTQTLMGSEAEAGTTLIDITTTFKYDNGTDFQPESTSQVLINTTSHEMLLPNGTPMGLYMLFPAFPDAAAYPMAYDFLGVTFMGAAMQGAMTETTVEYNFSSTEVIDAAIFGMPGVGANMTLGYNYLVDKITGMVMDVNVQINVENNSIGLNMDLGFLSQNDPMDTGMKNIVMAWAISGEAAEVLEVSMDLYDMEASAAVMKAAATSQLLLIADGVKPALDLELTFNATTKATMLATATATVAQLEQLPALIGAHQMKALLASKENKVLYVYYKKINEEDELNQFEDVEGSVEYWADIAKDKEADYNTFAVILPTILYVLCGIGIVIGLVLILAPGRKSEEAEE